PGVAIAATVEDDLLDAGGLGPVRKQRADLTGDGALVTLGPPDGRVHRRRRGQRVALEVVDDLGADVPERSSDHQARTLRRAIDPLADAEVPARPPDAARRGVAARAPALDQRGAHFLPAFPALRRMTSPW